MNIPLNISICRNTPFWSNCVVFRLISMFIIPRNPVIIPPIMCFLSSCILSCLSFSLRTIQNNNTTTTSHIVSLLFKFYILYIKGLYFHNHRTIHMWYINCRWGWSFRLLQEGGPRSRDLSRHWQNFCVKPSMSDMRNTQTKYWFFTSSETEEPPYDSSSMTYLIAGRETCPDTDTSTGSAISNSKRSNLARAPTLKLPTTARRRTPIP